MDADPDGTSIMFQLLFLVFLTLVNAFFAGAEMAVVSVNKNKIKVLAEDGNKKAMLVQTLLGDSTKFLSTIQVAITFAGFLSSASAATGISQVLGEWLEQFGLPYSSTIAVVVFTIVLSYFNLVFGELVPKRVALQKAEAFSMMTVKPIYLISRILSPFIKLLSVSTNGVLRLMGMRTENLEEAVSEEEIKAMLEMGREAGVFNKEERDMINSVFSFDDKLARDVMVPRRDVFAIDLGEPFEDYMDEVLESRHSRIPVYEESIDNIVGILHMKDFMIEMHKTAWSELDLKSLIQPAFFVPDSKNTDELFRQMQKSRNHMAVLIDEYGGFSGIVTIEDLVEEIVGDINEEYDTVVPDIQQTGENTYRLDGGMLIEDINEQLDLDLKTENYDTLSGYLIEKLGYIPSGNQESVVCEYGKFIVEQMEGRRIRTVMLEMAD
jgi:putative hemolysin